MKERFIFVPAICTSCKNPGFNIVDTQDEIDPSPTMHVKEDFEEAFAQISKQMQEKGLQGIEYLDHIIPLIERVHIIPIPDIKIDDSKSPLFVWSAKTKFATEFKNNLARIYRLRKWLKEDARPFVFIPENFRGFGDWIDVFILPNDMQIIKEEPSLLNSNKLYSKQQTREYIADCFEKGWLEDFDRVQLLSEVNNLESFPEQTEEEIKEDQAKQN